MKTGKAAALLEVDPTTIKNWIERFKEFFSSGALPGNLQRELDHADLLVLNTIRALRESGEQDWEQIRAFLRTGEREQTLPVSGLTVDIGETALAQLERTLTTSARLEGALTKVDELEGEIGRLRETIDKQRGNISELEHKLSELEKAKAVADALAQQELAFWRTGRLRYEPPTET